MEGQIHQLLAGFYDVQTADGKLYRTRARGNFRKRNISPMVGDFVTFSAEEGSDGYILSIEDRRNALVRPPVTNVDQAVVVTAVTEPSFSANLLDRQLVALETQGITPIIYFTKTDLINADSFAKLVPIAEGYRKIGYPVFLTKDAFGQKILSELLAMFADRLTVFMGQTGAGKSTLLNHLAPGLDLATGEISQVLNRGKHTTRKVGLLAVGGGLVADTPGFSSYEDFTMDVRELGQYFPELAQLSADCRFRGCQHINEPGCAVKTALENNEIMASRYNDYLQFHQLIADQKPRYDKNKK
ncbi:ribosome small subunit-dependent GTPase A [Furfurilactobacillus siliginis]|uniref:Small ribosomal subunit biogenesis GTPase RsgA n=1 Tax=Furfurilactobacillus siliginis TaxID=348151 RepID=A0A0R2L572_9LACO|nr:ribosome small subunit-dependent GTPase A [Furfurilactobacillus siliginis]KRN96895.1 ribosome small subunit-dependent GTPase A [Furfurilactobacillus siliginis]GEK28091.1 putative ribosome biogenesis GTPase RsgA 1 [Furfurilactobacillus siliginis]